MDESDEQLYHVVVNDEEQYSIWPAGRSIPSGWTAMGTVANRQECLAAIEEQWVDMRPLSLRRIHAT